MMTLRDMTATEYIAYRQFFIGEYARDLSANHGYGIEQGRINAIASIDGYLPQGVETPDNQLFCIEAGDVAHQQDERPLAGYLWIGCKSKAAYILDFCILPAWRRRGLGRGAMALLDQLLRAQGATELGLRVAADNPGARALYDECGFRVTGVNMVKPL